MQNSNPVPLGWPLRVEYNCYTVVLAKVFFIYMPERPHTNVCSQLCYLIYTSVGLRSPGYTNCLSGKFLTPENKLLWLTPHSIPLLLSIMHSFIPASLIFFCLLGHNMVSPAPIDPLPTSGILHVYFCLPRMTPDYLSLLVDAPQLLGTGNGF